MSKRDDYGRAQEQYSRLLRWLDGLKYRRVDFEEDRNVEGGAKIVISVTVNKDTNIGRWPPRPESESVGSCAAIDAALRSSAADKLTAAKDAAVKEARETLEELEGRPRLDIRVSGEFADPGKMAEAIEALKPDPDGVA